MFNSLKTRVVSMISKTMIVFMVFIFFAAKAQYPGYKPVQNATETRVIFAAGSSKISTITSSFKQEKILTALTEKIVSRGEFKFKRSDKVRLEYTTPFYYLMIMNGDKMIVKDQQKESQINVRSNKLFQQINRIMIDCIQGSILDSKDFEVILFENDARYLLEMTPISKSLKGFFSTIVLVVEKKDFSVYSIDMNEASGDKTVMTFTGKKINTILSDAIFAF